MITSTLLTPMTIFSKMSIRIIKEQELIIGPVAWNEARKVQGLTVIDSTKEEVDINGDEKEVLNVLNTTPSVKQALRGFRLQ